MKKCPTCNKTFEDSMRFCQTDGTPLVDDEPEFDPYATIVAKPGEVIIPPAAEEPAPAQETSPERADEHVLEPVAASDESSAGPISEPQDVLDLPERGDPLKTMYVSEAEMQAAFGTSDDEQKQDEDPQPQQPSFNVPDIQAPTFGDVAPP